MPRPPSRAGLSSTSQRELCWHLAQGANREEAAKLAGLPDATRLQHYARTKDFADDLRDALRDHMATNLAPRAVKVLADILNDEKVNPKIRVDAGKAILDRAGFSAGEAGKPSTERELNELSLDQLYALVNRLEAERAAAAEPVAAVEVGSDDEAARIREIMS